MGPKDRGLVSIEMREPVGVGRPRVFSPTTLGSWPEYCAKAERSLPRVITKFALVASAASANLMSATADHRARPPCQAAFSLAVQLEAVVKK